MDGHDGMLNAPAVDFKGVGYVAQAKEHSAIVRADGNGHDVAAKVA